MVAVTFDTIRNVSERALLQSHNHTSFFLEKKWCLDFPKVSDFQSIICYAVQLRDFCKVPNGLILR